MLREPSSHLSDGFQIRHGTLGVHQGSAIELAFWHPSSTTPEYGLCRFATEQEAESYVVYLSSSACPGPLDPNDLTIEPYDLTEHERLTSDRPLPSAWENPIDFLTSCFMLREHGRVG